MIFFFLPYIEILIPYEVTTTTVHTNKIRFYRRKRRRQINAAYSAPWIPVFLGIKACRDY